MKKAICSFAIMAAILSIMLQYGPSVIGTAGSMMIDEFSSMAESLMPSDGSEPDYSYANQTLSTLDGASQNTLGKLDIFSQGVLSEAEQFLGDNGSENEGNVTEEEADAGALAFVDKAFDEGSAIVWDFVMSIAGE